MVGSVPPDESCELPDGEMNYEEWDTTHNKNVADNNDTHILIKLGVIIKCYRGQTIFKNCNIIPLQLSIKEYQHYLKLQTFALCLRYPLFHLPLLLTRCPELELQHSKNLSHFELF